MIEGLLYVVKFKESKKTPYRLAEVCCNLSEKTKISARGSGIGNDEIYFYHSLAT